MQLWPAAQLLPHAPQLSGSVWKDAASRHPVPHLVCSAGQLATHIELEQSGVAAGHAMLQAPQFAPSALVLTQALPQAVKPAWHMQLPLQTWPALQTVPHAPQLATSLLVLTQACPQAASEVGHVQAPLVHVCVAPHAGMHCAALLPPAEFPPIPSPPVPLVPKPLPPVCVLGVA